MSKEAFVEFYEGVVRNNEALLAELNSARSEQELAALAVSKGKSSGFEFSSGDVLEVLKLAHAKRLQTPLNDGELESVSGGFLSPNFEQKVNYDINFVSSDLLSSSRTIKM